MPVISPIAPPLRPRPGVRDDPIDTLEILSTILRSSQQGQGAALIVHLLGMTDRWILGIEVEPKKRRVEEITADQLAKSPKLIDDFVAGTIEVF